MPLDCQIYDTVVEMSSVTIPATVVAIRVNGYSSAGDGGAALYRKVASQPSHQGKFQTLDGAWWELAESQPRPQMFGVISGVDDTAIVQKAIDYGASCVMFPDGNYAIQQIVPKTGTCLLAENRGAKFTAIGSSHVVFLNGVSMVSIRNIFFQGNNTPGVNGVYSDNSNDIEIIGCKFDQFGTTDDGAATTTAAIWMHIGCYNILIKENKITGGTGKNNGNDIMVYANSGEAIISGNRCYSPNSSGIYANAVNPAGRVIIAGNITKNHKRHGIIPVYGGSSGYRADCTIVNNVCVDCDSTGIYVNSDLSGFTIVGNVVYSCSGGGTNGYTLDGGIVIIGAGRKIVSNNYIGNSGKTSAGITRTIDTLGVTNDPTRVCAIRLNATDHCLVSGNLVEDSTGRGINVYGGATGSQLFGNTVLNCALASIYVESMNVSGEFWTVKGNMIDQSGSDGYGLWHRGGTVNDSVQITSNTFVGKKAGTSKSGVRLEGSGTIGKISDNEFRNWDDGLDIANAAITAKIGNVLLVSDNVFTGNSSGLTFLGTAVAGFGFHSGNIFSANATDIKDTYVQGALFTALAVWPRKVVYAPAAPTAGVWAVGDRVINSIPAAGVVKAWTCTGAGTPGVWLSEGTL